MKEARRFQYRQRSADDVKRRANMRGGGYDVIFKPEFKEFKAKEGKNLIRILPPTWDDANHYGYDTYVNYNIGADNQKYLSLSKMKNEKDPLAEAKRDAEKNGDKKLAKALQPTQRILMWVIDRQNEDEGPQLFACPFKLDKAIANLSYDEDTKEILYLDDPNEGRDIRFYRVGTTLNTEYDPSKIKIFDPSPLSEDAAQAEDWMEFVEQNPIPSALVFHDYEHISNVFNGTAGRRDDDEDEQRPAPRKPARDEDEDARPAPKAKPKPAPFDDEDEEVDVAPKSVARKRPESKDEDGDEPQAPAVKPSLRDRLQTRRTRIDEEVED